MRAYTLSYFMRTAPGHEINYEPGAVVTEAMNGWVRVHKTIHLPETIDCSVTVPHGSYGVELIAGKHALPTNALELSPLALGAYAPFDAAMVIVRRRFPQQERAQR